MSPPFVHCCLKQAGRLRRSIPAVNYQFLSLHRLPAAANVVLDASRIHLEACKHTPNIGVVIQAQDGLALQPGHQLGHLLVLLKLKFHAIAGCLPVRRVQVKQSVWPVVALHAFIPVQVFNIGTGQAQVRCRQVLFDSEQVEQRRSRSRAPHLAVDLAAEGVLLQVEETGRAL